MLTTYSGSCPACGDVNCEVVAVQDEDVYLSVTYQCGDGHEFEVRYTCGIVIDKTA